MAKNAAPPRLTLIDGSGFIFRAYHRLPPLTNPEGVPVGALFGFTAMLWNLVREARLSPEEDYLAVILDASRKSFRNDLYPDYKANRPPAPEDLVPQFPLIRDAVSALGIPCIEEEGFEADDLIASYTEAGVRAGMTVSIISSDKDLMQLVREGVSLRDTMQHKTYGVEEVEKRWGVPPAQLGELLALMGDTSDNVPGVPGVGPKTAARLVSEFGKVEDVLANWEQVKQPKLRQALRDNHDTVLLSRRLVALKDDIPLDPLLPGLKLADSLDEGPFAAFLKTHGFRSLLAKLSTLHSPAPATGKEGPRETPGTPISRDTYEQVTTVERLKWWCAEATRLGLVGFDTETTSLNAAMAQLVGFSLALEGGRACYVPLAHVSGDGLLAEVPPQIPLDEALPLLKELLEDPGLLKVGHNLKYDACVLLRYDIHIVSFEDTMLLSYAVGGGLRGHGMDELAQKLLGHETITYKEVAGSGKSQIGFAEVAPDEATRYAAEDADVTLRLYGKLKPGLWREKTTRTYEWCDRPLVPVIARMEKRGIRVDTGKLTHLSQEFATEMARLEEEVQEIAGAPFVLGSPKQLAGVLFEKMGLPGGKKGRSGQYSTDANELERVAATGLPGSEIAGKLLQWREVSKLRSTYTEALQQQINPETGRVHTSFALAATTTGRLASSDPNIQNIPVRTELGRRIREAFIAEEGNVLLSADYSQIELRLMAHIADVPELKEAYAEDADIHALTARRLFGIPAGEAVGRTERGQAKTINFSIIYGISAFGLAKRLGIGRGEAQQFIDRYLDHYPGIRRYMAETAAAARHDGFVTTLFGRRIHTPGIRAKTQAERAGAERAAINAPVQGTAADLIKRAMVRMEPALAGAGLKETRMLLQVHDELLFELPPAEIEGATAVIRTVMEEASRPYLSLSVPLRVEIGTGVNWGAAH